MLVAVACDAEATPAPGTPGPATGSPTDGTPATDAPSAGALTVAFSHVGTGEWAPARTGDQNQEVSKPLFDTLTRINHETGEFDPHLLESYSVSDDGLTWTFKLRPDIPFHDDWGTVTAEDVKFTWEQWIGPDSNHDLGAPLSEAVGGDMNNFVIVNDLEFTVTGQVPIVTLPTILGDQGNGLQVTSKRYFDEMGSAANDHPIGTGPWKYDSQTLNVEVVMEAVKDHWCCAPAFDTLVQKAVPDGSARLSQLQTGELDIALLDTTLLAEAEAAGLEFRVIPNVGNAFIILGGSYWGSGAHTTPEGTPGQGLDEDAPWIQSDNPERGKAIREALSLAIDRELIIDRILQGEAKLSKGAVVTSEDSPELTDASWLFPAYDPDAARQRLADGGYPDGFEISLFMYPDYIDLPAIGEAIAGMWEEIGVTVERMPADEGLLDAMLDQANTDGLAWVKIAGLKGDPSTQWNGYRSDVGRDYKFTHPAVDQGYDLMVAEFDQDARYAHARDIVEALAADTIAIPLFTANLPFAVSSRVGTWDPVPGLDELTGTETVTPAN
jgi:peptide/nickel transport system substrate-binding protein